MTVWEKSRTSSGDNEGRRCFTVGKHVFSGEDKNDPELAKQMAKLCDVYIDDAFAVAHRAAASNTAITQFVPICA